MDRYRPNTFQALVDEVEEQGGAVLPDPCLPRVISYEGLPVPKIMDPETGEEVLTTSCGCGNRMVMTRMVSIYEPERGDQRARGAGFVTSCAVCDGMGAWPRYADAVRAVNSEYWDELGL